MKLTNNLLESGELSMYDEDVDDFLAHYGVKGMKWGVRRNGNDRPEGVSARVNRDAKKDAREFARAKMFYGEGAGTRRKLIKATVDQKSNADPSYKKAFDHHLENQDMGRHVSKAKSERRRKDVTASTTKTAKGVHRQLTGGFGNVSLASAAIAGGYVVAKQTGADKIVIDAAKQSFATAKKAAANKQNQKAVSDWMKQQGWA